MWEEGVEMYLELLRSFEPLPKEVLLDKDNASIPFAAMKYKLSPALFFQCVVHATDICDKNSMNRKGIELIETAFKHNNETMNAQR